MSTPKRFILRSVGRVELHLAVARAIAEAGAGRSIFSPERADALARVAVGVVLAEAQRSIEALRAARAYDGTTYAIGADDALGEALAVLAALGEQA